MTGTGREGFSLRLSKAFAASAASIGTTAAAEAVVERLRHGATRAGAKLAEQLPAPKTDRRRLRDLRPEEAKRARPAGPPTLVVGTTFAGATLVRRLHCVKPLPGLARELLEDVGRGPRGLAAAVSNCGSLTKAVPNRTRAGGDWKQRRRCRCRAKGGLANGRAERSDEPALRRAETLPPRIRHAGFPAANRRCVDSSVDGRRCR